MLSLAALPLLAAAAFPDKLYVVERDRARIAVVSGGEVKSEIEGVGDLSHGVIKFHGNSAYVASRDGFLSRVDTASDRVEKKVKAGESSIGVDFFGSGVCLANYEPKNVVVFGFDLESMKAFDTGSRNVGIKGRGEECVFALMDKNEIWSVGAEGVKKLYDTGRMPFDALLKGDTYLIGFFKESGVGVIDLKSGGYRKVPLGEGSGGGTIFKIPHFGTWGVSGGSALIPAVGEKRAHIVDLSDFSVKGTVELTGLPVFVVMSPDGKSAVINHSGEREDFISVVDMASLKAVKEIKAGRRIMHMRFSPDGKRLYVTSFFENRLKAFDASTWEELGGMDVPSPSGIFIVN